MTPQSLLRFREMILEAGHDAAAYVRRLAHRPHLPRLEPRDREIADALETDGFYVTDLDALSVAGSGELLRASDRLLGEMAQLTPAVRNKDYMVSAPPDLITKFPEIVLWGLDERLLALAETYIGLPVTYRGVLARLDRPDGTIRETRIWHLDQEDARILKIVVYLDDVDQEGGPFECIPATFRQPRDLARGPKLRINDDAAFAKAVTPECRRTVTGPRGTVAFVDTCRMFHRGRAPTSGTRKSLFYAYNSHHPMRPSHCGPMFLVDPFKAAAGRLSPRQVDALDFGYYRRFG